jgi:hypothetical protein
MVEMPITPATDQTPRMILEDLAINIEGIKQNASIVYKQLGEVGLKLYNIIEDKKVYVLCQKSEDDLLEVHVNLLDLY